MILALGDDINMEVAVKEWRASIPRPGNLKRGGGGWSGGAAPGLHSDNQPQLIKAGIVLVQHNTNHQISNLHVSALGGGEGMAAQYLGDKVQNQRQSTNSIQFPLRNLMQVECQQWRESIPQWRSTKIVQGYGFN